VTELLGTPNLGTGVLEHRDRIDFGALRRARQQRVLAAMADHGLDACLFGREANARYVSGVRRLWTAQTRPFVPACAVVPRPAGAPSAHVELLSFSASYEDIPDEVGPDHFFPVTWNPAKMMARLEQIPGFLDARRVGFDGLSPLFEGLLRSLLPTAEFVGVEDLMLRARRRKLPAEVVCLRTAAAVAEAALYAAASEVRPGVTERHLQGVFLERMCMLGTSQFAQQGTFTVVDPGAPLRRITSGRTLDEGSMVALAGGVLWAGYEGSLARTWWCGRHGGPTTEQRDLFSRWRDLTAAVREQCRPGRTGADLRAAYERSGEAAPTMSIAYAVGLGHEAPLAGPGMSPALERAQVLEPDMVVAVRAFVSGGGGGFFGEDMLLVTEAGAEPLTTLGHGPLATDP